MYVGNWKKLSDEDSKTDNETDMRPRELGVPPYCIGCHRSVGVDDRRDHVYRLLEPGMCATTEIGVPITHRLRLYFLRVRSRRFHRPRGLCRRDARCSRERWKAWMTYL